ncbi:unnamed protein product [Mytilus coruscus]|uniref:Uncharacterized protein n=1 Tax=Mytilus coruscus TaxID=42192 RepID=A0A6J8C7E7_MYTCO|nr:unnamed protein product [Mytilus coruscus]
MEVGVYQRQMVDHMEFGVISTTDGESHGGRSISTTDGGSHGGRCISTTDGGSHGGRNISTTDGRSHGSRSNINDRWWITWRSELSMTVGVVAVLLNDGDWRCRQTNRLLELTTTFGGAVHRSRGYEDSPQLMVAPFSGILKFRSLMLRSL